MLISSCQISNYKSFLKSEELRFTEGFNVIVGKNNVGKTALIEALSPTYTDKPHRSLETIPQRGATLPGQSEVMMDLIVSPEEYQRLLASISPFSAAFFGREDQPVYVQERFFKSLGRGHVIHSRFGNNTCLGARLDDERGDIAGALDITFDPKTRKFVPGAFSSGFSASSTYPYRIASLLRQSIYVFRAERLNVSQSSINESTALVPNASNLPAVLHVLQTTNPARFERFNADVRTVFPDIQQISTRPIGNATVQIDVWGIEPQTERNDLAVPLSECGTGIGQVLAMLYVVMTSDDPKTIIIDEPQSFLHPGAIRKLFDILKRHPEHQYIISTHSPTVVTSANPRTLLLLQKEGNETKTQVLSVSEASELRMFLSDIGARLSDVFGADNILWVEGRTEEVCFRLIAESILEKELLGTEIIGVKHVGDLEGRHAKTVFEIYDRLCTGHGLLPPALAFSFDREGRPEKEREELTANSRGLIHFIPRRMYENFLLNPKAIAKILSDTDTGKSKPVDENEVREWIEAKKADGNYLDATGDPNHWLRDANAAKLLTDLFNDLSGARVSFNKLTHGVKLTEWIIENSHTDFDELATFLKQILETDRK
jgi:energy-coupling factor transporter ATP-binding protein EcfA2